MPLSRIQVFSTPFSISAMRWPATPSASNTNPAGPPSPARTSTSPPAKAPLLSPVSVYNWTGLYVGAHLGYAGGRSNWSAPPDLASSLDLFQSSDIFTGSGSYFGGLQIGYDFMLANRVVLGAQLDASFPGFRNRDGISIGGTSRMAGIL